MPFHPGFFQSRILGWGQKCQLTLISRSMRSPIIHKSGTQRTLSYQRQSTRLVPCRIQFPRAICPHLLFNICFDFDWALYQQKSSNFHDFINSEFFLKIYELCQIWTHSKIILKILFIMKSQRSIFKKTVKSFNTKNFQNKNFSNFTLKMKIKFVIITTTTLVLSQISKINSQS